MIIIATNRTTRGGHTPWYALRPARTLELTAVLSVVLLVLALRYYHDQLARIPEPGRLTPTARALLRQKTERESTITAAQTPEAPR